MIGQINEQAANVGSDYLLLNNLNFTDFCIFCSCFDHYSTINTQCWVKYTEHGVSDTLLSTLNYNFGVKCLQKNLAASDDGLLVYAG